MIKAGTLTNISQVSKRYREDIVPYMAQYGYAVDEKGNFYLVKE